MHDDHQDKKEGCKGKGHCKEGFCGTSKKKDGDALAPKPHKQGGCCSPGKDKGGCCPK